MASAPTGVGSPSRQEGKIGEIQRKRWWCESQQGNVSSMAEKIQ